MSADPSNAVPSDTLDFVVGGIPRSGTTALAIALCAHPEVYAYASETGLFRFAHEFFRRGPFPKSGFEALRTQIETDLDTALTLHTRDFVVQQARDLELLARAFPDQRLFPLLDDLAAAFFIDDATRVLAGGVHGAAAYRAVANLLGSTFRARSGRRIVGEKTPDNIKALADLRTAIPSMKAIATVRDPFATLKSMAQRAARGEQHDREFSRHLVRNIGNYLDNLQTLVTAQAAGDQLLVLRYEDLLDDGAGVMRRAFAHLGASDDEAAVSLAAAILRPRPDRAAAADYFHPAERALIARVLAPSVAPFGYTLDAPETVEFSGATRATDPALVAALAERRPKLLAMSGFHGQESEFSGALMSSSATALLVLPEEIGETTIDIWSGVDRASPLEENRLRLTDATGREVYGCDIGSRGEQSTVRLITDELLLEPLFNGLRYMVLDMTASNSVRPVALKSGEATGDLREQALQTRGSAFHEWAALAQRYRTIAEDLRSQLTGQRHLIVAAERRAAAAEEQQGFLGQQLAAERAFLAAEREKFADNLARAEQTLAEARAAAEAALAAERALLEEERT
ncbi:MAG: sulfotransferase, partial [Hyphomicrobiaceae bacterium]